MHEPDVRTLCFLVGHFKGERFTADNARMRVPSRLDLMGARHTPAYGLPITARAWVHRLRHLEQGGWVECTGEVIDRSRPLRSLIWKLTAKALDRIWEMPGGVRQESVTIVDVAGLMGR